MIYAYTRLRYQMSVYRTIGPLVVLQWCISNFQSFKSLLSLDYRGFCHDVSSINMYRYIDQSAMYFYFLLNF